MPRVSSKISVSCRWLVWNSLQGLLRLADHLTTVDSEFSEHSQSTYEVCLNYHSAAVLPLGKSGTTIPPKSAQVPYFLDKV